MERCKRLEWLISTYVNRDSDAVRFEAKETAAAAAAAAVQTRASRPLGSYKITLEPAPSFESATMRRTRIEKLATLR